jgi:CRP-like cAMP-binding protein
VNSAVKVKKGEVLLQHGQAGNFIYVIESGEFSVRKSFERQLMTKSNDIGQLLNQGFSAGQRNVMTTKMSQLTKLRQLTQAANEMTEREILTLGVGQVFGE